MCSCPETYETQAEVTLCYKKLVWAKQCKYAKQVMSYLQKLQFGMACCDELEHLKNERRALLILNCYDTRDILPNTTEYNALSYQTIKDLLNL